MQVSTLSNPVDGHLKVSRMPEERFPEPCIGPRVQAVGESVHVWVAFHNGAIYTAGHTGVERK